MDFPRKSPLDSPQRPRSLLPSPLLDDGGISPPSEAEITAGFHETYLPRDQDEPPPPPPPITAIPRVLTSAPSNETSISDQEVSNPDASSSLEAREAVEGAAIAAAALNFKPFFALIEDTTTGEHYHPHVHYVFSDDDSGLLTDAVLSTLQLPTSSTKDAAGVEDALGTKSTAAKPNTTDQPSKPQIDMPMPDERILIIDLSADGSTVSKAGSLTSAWQIMEHSISRAPTFDQQAAGGSSSGGGSEPGNLVLKISGREVEEERAEGDLQASMLLKQGAKESEREDDATTTSTALEAVQKLARQYEDEMKFLRRAAGLDMPKS